MARENKLKKSAENKLNKFYEQLKEPYKEDVKEAEDVFDKGSAMAKEYASKNSQLANSTRGDSAAKGFHDATGISSSEARSNIKDAKKVYDKVKDLGQTSASMDTLMGLLEDGAPDNTDLIDRAYVYNMRGDEAIDPITEAIRTPINGYDKLIDNIKTAIYNYELNNAADEVEKETEARNEALKRYKADKARGDKIQKLKDKAGDIFGGILDNEDFAEYLNKDALIKNYRTLIHEGVDQEKLDKILGDDVEKTRMSTPAK